MYRLNDYLRNTYGEKLYKISLGTGATCPNRDGLKGYGGCIFCDGSGAFSQIGNIKKQIEDAKELISKKYTGNSYIAYFSSFTNTYGNEDELRNIFNYVASLDEVKIISIATRWDCLSDKMYNILYELSEKKDLWIEFGLQSCKQETHDLINSKLIVDEFDYHVNKLRMFCTQVVAHQIVGLPYEDDKDIINTAKYIIDSGANGIKIHLLHVLRGTKLHELYENKAFDVLSMEDYTDKLINILSILPEYMVVHRFSGDGDKKKLVAPMWSADKKRVLNYINKNIREAGIIFK